MRQNFQERRETAALATGSSVIPFHVERDPQGQALMLGQPVIPFGANGSGPQDQGKMGIQQLQAEIHSLIPLHLWTTMEQR